MTLLKEIWVVYVGSHTSFIRVNLIGLYYYLLQSIWNDNSQSNICGNFINHLILASGLSVLNGQGLSDILIKVINYDYLTNVIFRIPKPW